VFDEDQAKSRSRVYSYYFRNWFPARKDAAIADLACGNGTLLYLFEQQGYHNLSGVDLSPQQSKAAQARFPQVEEGDVFAFLERHKESFDLLTAIDLIEHFQKDEVLAFLDACYGALKPGGRLILQTPNAAALMPGYFRYGDFTHEVCFHDKILAQLLQLSHFEQVEPREAGPIPTGYSMGSTIRYALWQGVRLGVRAIRTIESGAPLTDVITSVFLISAVKPH
jgi:2-polyprenyl-3-methyl-5-hydroxy-6-metoxy-1,4-benzoquinol methylase